MTIRPKEEPNMRQYMYHESWKKTKLSKSSHNVGKVPRVCTSQHRKLIILDEENWAIHGQLLLAIVVGNTAALTKRWGWFCYSRTCHAEGTGCQSGGKSQGIHCLVGYDLTMVSRRRPSWWAVNKRRAKSEDNRFHHRGTAKRQVGRFHSLATRTPR